MNLYNTGFIWILLACAVYGVIHSVLASNTAKSLAAHWFGQAARLRFYRLFFVFAALATTLPLLALVPLLPDSTIYRIPAPWVIPTLAIQALAVIALAVGVLQTGALAFLGIRQFLEAAPFREKLVTGGLYRRVRHPLYAAAFLLLWLAPVMTWNLLALNIGFSAYLLIGTIFEERKLVQQFGKEYAEYRKRTPRIVPRIK